ncbi:MAG TPA: DUF3738 domain-containing protein [Terracidiphilus sp.]
MLIRPGSQGGYDAVLDFGADDVPANADSSEAIGLLPLPGALEKQVGLKLVKQNAQVNTFVIDHIETLSVAASVLAKVHRGRMMVELDSQFPGYRLASHKGYRSAEHLAALARLGAQPMHRKCFHPVAQSLLQFD